MTSPFSSAAAAPILTRSLSSGATDVPLIEQTLGAFFDAMVARQPEHEALVSAHQRLRYSYRELQSASKQLASNLQAPCSGSVWRPVTGSAFGRTTTRNGC